MNIVPSLTVSNGYRELAPDSKEAGATAAPAGATDIWKKIKNGFRALMEEEDRIVQQGRLSGWCYAHINCPDSRGPGGWWFGSLANESLQARFELLATEAAIALGSPPETIPHAYWLNRLLLDLRANESNHVRCYSDTVSIIERLFEASAIYCTRLERLSLEKGAMVYEKPEWASQLIAERDAETAHERSERRSAVVIPMLRSKRWTRSKWAAHAGVGKNCAYEYLSGKRNLGIENKQALAEELGLKPEHLPD
jgi:hypothetical protein